MFDVKQYPDMSWSLSRHKMLMSCPTQYYFSYYLSHNGWLRDANQVSKDTYRLKKIISTDILLGNSIHSHIHNQICRVEAGEEPIPGGELVERVRRDLNMAYIDSTKRIVQWQEKPNKISMLSEIYFDGQLSKEKVQEIQVKTGLSIEQFLSSQTFNKITKNSDVKIVDAERFRVLKVNGVNVFAVLDLVYQDENDRYVIVDWKTGKERPEDFQQVSLYAWFLHEKLEIPLDLIEARVEYLQLGKQKKIQFNPIDIESVKYTFHISLEMMEGYLEDVELNKPMELGAFPKTGDARTCMNCNFRELCAGA